MQSTPSQSSSTDRALARDAPAEAPECGSKTGAHMLLRIVNQPNTGIITSLRPHHPMARRTARIGSLILAWIGLASILCPHHSVAGVVISEFVASNSTGLQDEDGDRPDWI